MIEGSFELSFAYFAEFAKILLFQKNANPSLSALEDPGERDLHRVEGHALRLVNGECPG